MPTIFVKINDSYISNDLHSFINLDKRSALFFFHLICIDNSDKVLFKKKNAQKWYCGIYFVLFKTMNSFWESFISIGKIAIYRLWRSHPAFASQAMKGSYYERLNVIQHRFNYYSRNCFLHSHRWFEESGFSVNENGICRSSKNLANIWKDCDGSLKLTISIFFT